jgi:hypothetical protein
MNEQTNGSKNTGLRCMDRQGKQTKKKKIWRGRQNKLKLHSNKCYMYFLLIPGLTKNYLSAAIGTFYYDRVLKLPSIR